MSGPGRQTLDKPEYASRARELCARGATNPDLAGRFGVARSTMAATSPMPARSNRCSRALPATTICPGFCCLTHGVQSKQSTRK